MRTYKRRGPNWILAFGRDMIVNLCSPYSCGWDSAVQISDVIVLLAEMSLSEHKSRTNLDICAVERKMFSKLIFDNDNVVAASKLALSLATICQMK